jgi:hypothetical protein
MLIPPISPAEDYMTSTFLGSKRATATPERIVSRRGISDTIPIDIYRANALILRYIHYECVCPRRCADGLRFLHSCVRGGHNFDSLTVY